MGTTRILMLTLACCLTTATVVEQFIDIDGSGDDEECDLPCTYGYETENGVQLCQCKDPCIGISCPYGDRCTVKKGANSLFFAQCEADPQAVVKVRPDMCHLPKDSGPCFRYESKFYFNPVKGRCMHFVFGGCGGNNNNFKTWEECEMSCQVCSLPADKGPCYGFLPRYYYNDKLNQCELFWYGGCRGNDNNFLSQATCEKACIYREKGAMFLRMRTKRK